MLGHASTITRTINTFKNVQLLKHTKNVLNVPAMVIGTVSAGAPIRNVLTVAKTTGALVMY